MGRDIKGEIGSRLHWQRNVSVDGFQDHYDALTLILDACIERGIKPSEFFNFRFEVNTQLGICKVTPNDEPKREADSLMDLEDLIAWSKLGGYLDPTVQITWKCNDIEGSDKGFVFFDIDRSCDTFVRHYVPCEGYASNPHICKYIADEYITKIEKI